MDLNQNKCCVFSRTSAGGVIYFNLHHEGQKQCMSADWWTQTHHSLIHPIIMNKREKDRDRFFIVSFSCFYVCLLLLFLQTPSVYNAAQTNFVLLHWFYLNQSKQQETKTSMCSIFLQNNLQFPPKSNVPAHLLLENQTDGSMTFYVI